MPDCIECYRNNLLPMHPGHLNNRNAGRNEQSQKKSIFESQGQRQENGCTKDAKMTDAFPASRHVVKSLPLRQPMKPVSGTHSSSSEGRIAEFGTKYLNIFNCRLKY